MKVTSKNYDGKLYIKLGRKHIPLEQTVEYFESIEKENEQLKQQIEQMKCCGNCKHRNTKEVVETCKKKKTYTLNKGFCDKWEENEK